MFIDNLIDRIKEKKNPSVVGLDPRIEYVPQFIKEKAFSLYGENLKAACQSILEFNKRIIDVVYDIIPAVKLQIAYYEMYGLHGLKVFDETIKYAKEKGLLVIADEKRFAEAARAETIKMRDEINIATGGY
jgi:orotidine-5'-phosphate decarboxylase